MKKNTAPSNFFSQTNLSQGKITKALLKRLFDDALDNLEVTYDAYYMIDLYRPRSISIFNWLLNNVSQKGNVLVISPLPITFTMLFEKLGFTVKDISLTWRHEPWKVVENQVMISALNRIVSELPGDYDIIICDDLLQYLVSPAITFQELKEKLKPEGIIILTTPNVARGTMRLMLLMGRNIYPWLENNMLNCDSINEDAKYLIPYREYTFQEIETIMSNNGFALITGQHLIGKKTINNSIANQPISISSYLFRKIYYVVQKFFPSVRSHLFFAAKRIS